MSIFPVHTAESAPEASAPVLTRVTRAFGFIPGAVALLATSPELLDGFLTASATFEKTTLSHVEREIVILTVARRNDCHLCIAMHTATLVRADAPPELIGALRTGEELPDERFQALATFVECVMDHNGDVPAAEFQAFLDHGYTARNALEVVLGVGAYTMSTLANRLTDAPVDDAFAAFAP